MSIYDLHTHSTCSDGKFLPKDVVNQAFENGVKYLSLTDHDTISGVSEALEEASKLGLNLIPGIELSTEHNGEPIHVLGYFRDDEYKNLEFLKILENIRKGRINRAYKIVEKLKKYFNIELDIDKVLAGGNETIARPHIAKAIINAGYPYDMNCIFDTMIGNNCKAYVPSTTMPTSEGIEILKKFNAFSVLAHPIYIKKTPLSEMLKFDFDGIEAIYAQNTEKQTNDLLEVVKQGNLLTSCGSDCHGYFHNPTHPVIGKIKTPTNINVDKLLNWVTTIK